MRDRSVENRKWEDRVGQERICQERAGRVDKRKTNRGDDQDEELPATLLASRRQDQTQTEPPPEAGEGSRQPQ